MGHGGNVIDELMSDHREVEEMFGRIQAMSGQGRQLRDLVDQVTIELVRHSVAEEQYLYPAVREHVDGGDSIADKEIEDHNRVEKLLKRLEKTDIGSSEMSPLLQQLMDEVAAHVQDEESNLFRCCARPAPRSSWTTSATRSAGPSPWHPPARTPPHRAHRRMNKLLAPGVGLVDRARDFVTGRGKS